MFPRDDEQFQLGVMDGRLGRKGVLGQEPGTIVGLEQITAQKRLAMTKHPRETMQIHCIKSWKEILDRDYETAFKKPGVRRPYSNR